MQQVQTINPGMFQLGASRDASPTTNMGMLNNASPQAIFSSNSSTSEETYNGAPAWNNGGMVQNPAWTQDYNAQFASPGGPLGFTPSPVVNGATPSMASTRSSTAPTGSTMGRSPLHIAPISTKSRVETQINVIMTLEKPPTGAEFVHLPLHTIAKSKLLAKEEYDRTKSLELHTMLVCTSAMHTQANRDKALRKAAAQNNTEIQRRAEVAREQAAADEAEGKQPEDPTKSVPEEERAANGGEVKICPNCIQRERKRAGRKKLKKEEEQQHWERFETERVVVFNSNEFLPLKPPEPVQQSHSGGQHHQDGFGAVQDGTSSQSQERQNKEPYAPPEGSTQVTAAMRIACYCRHQSEKEGFQVIFTLKDHVGNVVAQQMSDSILITDDHKTHPPTFGPTTLPGGEPVFYQPGFAAAVSAGGMGGAGGMIGGLPHSHSMVDLSNHAYPFTASRSTGNLQAMAYGAQSQTFNPHSHVHQLPASGYSSQATSATMTPTSLSRPPSRPGSPTSAGQLGPNKKRKSSSFHRKVPSGLTMTPRVDTSQPPSSNLPSALSTVTSPFSPTGDGGAAGFGQQGNYMTIPTNNGPAQYYGSGPPTPSENQQNMFSGGFTQSQLEQHLARSQNAQAYFSHPSSAVPSRASSPVLQQSMPGRSGIAAYARQQGGQNAAPQTYQQQARQPPQQQMQQQYQHQPMQVQQSHPQPAAGGADMDTSSPPTITKITPADGPYVGGTEVSIYGYNFTNGTQVLFGDKLAVTVFYGPQALLATSPPSRPGGVNVTLVPPNAQQNSTYQSPPSANRQIFTYTDHNPRMMEMALRYLSQQQTGSATGWNQLANQYATHFMSNNVSRAGIGGQGGQSGSGYEASEEDILNVVHACGQQGGVDIAEEETGATMLHLACTAGMSRVAGALLARGANANAGDKGGFTPLMHAALHGRCDVLALLLAHGADPMLRSRAGYRALDVAPVEVVRYLQRLLAPIRSTGQPVSNIDAGFAMQLPPESAAALPASASRRPSTIPDTAAWNNFSAASFLFPTAQAYSDYLPVGMEEMDWSRQATPRAATRTTSAAGGGGMAGREPNCMPMPNMPGQPASSPPYSQWLAAGA